MKVLRTGEIIVYCNECERLHQIDKTAAPPKLISAKVDEDEPVEFNLSVEELRASGLGEIIQH